MSANATIYIILNQNLLSHNKTTRLQKCRTKKNRCSNLHSSHISAKSEHYHNALTFIFFFHIFTLACNCRRKTASKSSSEKRIEWLVIKKFARNENLTNINRQHIAHIIVSSHWSFFLALLNEFKVAHVEGFFLCLKKCKKNWLFCVLQNTQRYIK
jgi:hypothetical protein